MSENPAPAQFWATSKLLNPLFIFPPGLHSEIPSWARKNQFIAIQLFNDFHSFSSCAIFQVFKRGWLWKNGEVYQGKMSLWFDFITTSVDNLCTWISVGNCVFVRPALWAGEKEHKSGSVSAVWVQPWMNSPRVARLLALTCHILKSSFVWEPPNIYPTLERAPRRAGGSVSQTKDDNGS